MRRNSLLLLLLCCAAFSFFGGATGGEINDGRCLLVEVRVDSREAAEWLSRYNVRLAAPGALLLEIGPAEESSLNERGFAFKVLCVLERGEGLYCCDLAAGLPDGFERVWSATDQSVQVLCGRALKVFPFGGHVAVPLPRDVCATSWFPAVAPDVVAGRRAGARARLVAAESDGANIEKIIDDLTYDALAGTLLTRYSFRTETVEKAMPYVRDLLADNLGPAGVVELQEFPMNSGEDPPLAYNIIGTLEGELDGAGYYIISAHYDAIASRTEDWNGMTDPAPGADDNASGVAAVLECARALASVPLDFDLKFIFFSGEEQGVKGSDYFVENLPDTYPEGPLLGVINLDMIAYNPAGDTLEVVTDPLSAWIADFIVSSYEDLAEEVGELSVSSIEKLRYPFSDDGSFQVKGYPAVTCIEKRDVELLNPYYHTILDNNIDGQLNIAQATKTAKLIAGALTALTAQGRLPDLEVLPDDIVFSAPPFPVVRRAEVGDTVTISVRVRNVGGPAQGDGELDPHQVDLELYDGDPDFGAPLITEETWTEKMPSLGGFVARAKWVPKEGDRGSHRITAVVALTGSPADEDPSNNRAQKTFAVIAERMDLLEAYVYPSPADPGGEASLHYFLTQPAGIAVDVFDAKGRRVGGMTRSSGGGRVPGVNFMEIRVPMAEVIDDFSKLPGGVYFYRIVAEDEELRREKKGRFIIVR